MIGKLKGVIDAYGEDFVIVDVHGVGYVVHCSSRTLQNLPKVGEAAVLSIETHVREDMIRLYGFRSDPEREWFRLLQTVQGVGAKVALGILSVLDPGGLGTAIATGDKASVARAPGVGPKLAPRIVAELKDKAPAFSAVDPALIRLSDAVDERTRARAGHGRGLGARQSRLRPGPGLRRGRRRPEAGRRRRRGEDADPAGAAGAGALSSPCRHPRARPEDPRLWIYAEKAAMAGPSPAMTRRIWTVPVLIIGPSGVRG